MKFAKLAILATALAATPIAAHAQDVGATVYGNDGNPIGTIESNDGANAVINTGKYSAALPVSAFGASDKGPTLNITKAAIEEQLAAAQAAQEQAMAEAKAKAEAEARAKADAEAQKAAEQKAKIETELEEIRQKRAKEREEMSAKRSAAQKEAVKKTPAEIQKSMVDKMIENLNWIHRRH